MDYGTFSGLYTLFLLLIFIGIIVWAYSKRRKKSFDEASRLIFDDEPAKRAADQAGDKSGSKQAGADKQ